MRPTQWILHIDHGPSYYLEFKSQCKGQSNYNLLGSSLILLHHQRTSLQHAHIHQGISSLQMLLAQRGWNTQRIRGRRWRQRRRVHHRRLQLNRHRNHRWSSRVDCRHHRSQLWSVRVRWTRTIRRHRHCTLQSYIHSTIIREHKHCE